MTGPVDFIEGVGEKADGFFECGKQHRVLSDHAGETDTTDSSFNEDIYLEIIADDKGICNEKSSGYIYVYIYIYIYIHTHTSSVYKETDR